MTSPAAPDLAATDSALVARAVMGDHQAFGQIVARYQALVCSLAYSATGSLQHSEDLAQETFLNAWRQLRTLREPSKLKSWLCTIVRHLASRSRHRESAQPTHAAHPLDSLHDSPSLDPAPSAQAISREEEAILWRSLAEIPESYREPMVLFYREHQSIERVAQSLEISEDTVKQRLFRGRKLLAEKVAAFVEGALERTVPGPAFTQGVLSALPVLAVSTKSVSLGAAAVKAGFLAKSLFSASWLGVIVGPILGLLGGWFGTQASLAAARSPRERQFIARLAWLSALGAVSFTVAVLVLFVVAIKFWDTFQTALITGIVGLPLAYAVFVFYIAFRSHRGIHRIRTEDGTLHSPPSANSIYYASSPFEYRSRWSLFGFALIHVHTGPTSNGHRALARGWIAIGDYAIGFIAIGGVSLGVISLGGLSLGLIGIGGVAFALLAFGGFALGWWALGGLAIGYFAYGGAALAWHAAMGGFALSHHYASGAVALAPHVGASAAHSALANEGFFAFATPLMDYAIFLIFLPIVSVTCAVIRVVRRQRRANAQLANPPSGP